jgi:hypothetical protein
MRSMKGKRQRVRRSRTSPPVYRALTSVDYIDAVYTSFEDAHHRVVTRIDPYRRRGDFRIPANANWHFQLYRRLHECLPVWYNAMAVECGR